MEYKKLLVTALLFVGISLHAMDDYHLDLMEKNLIERNDSSVSYIYYPKIHAEIEVEGTAYDRVGARSRPLQDMIEKSTSDGHPFLRFVFKTKPEQVENIKKYIDEGSWGISCAMRALEPLEKAGICSVPFPISFSPLWSAAYLASGKKLGLNNVSKIEYYGNPSMLKSILKMLPGASYELVAGSVLCQSAVLKAQVLLSSQETAEQCINL
jgi:hypothetical protein